MQKRQVVLLSALIAAGFTPGCGCEEEVFIKIAPRIQLEGDAAELDQDDGSICTDDINGCELHFGAVGLATQGSRTLLMANPSHVNLQVYDIKIDADSPEAPRLSTNWESVGSSFLAGKSFAPFKVYWIPEVETAEEVAIGTVVLVTNAENSTTLLDAETCSDLGALGACGEVRVQLFGRGVDNGLPEAKVIARVGQDAWDDGPCDFGYVGLRGQGACRVEVTNVGERDLLLFGAELGFRESGRDDCQTCSGQAWCGGPNGSCVAGPFAAEETPVVGEGFPERNPCDEDTRCELGQFCASDASNPEERFCSSEAEVPDGMSIFAFDAEPLFSQDNPLVVSPGSSATLTLIFKPYALRRYTGRLALKTNQLGQRNLAIGLIGVGHEAPTAVPEISAVNDGDPIRDDNGTVLVAPLDTVAVTGLRSFGANGAEITGYEWSFEESADIGAFRPHGSHLMPEDASNVTTELGFQNNAERWIRGVDTVGTYRIALRVQDEHGIWSSWETVDFTNIPGDSIHIQMTWDHPSSDVDLHVIRTGDRDLYRNREQDCYYASCKPVNGQPRLSWGPGGPEDDPILDLDDVNGFGPENINIDQPEDNQQYLVGVHYFSDHAWNGEEGQTDCTIRIYVWERLVFEEVMLLEETGNWWEVANIHWPEAHVETINDFYVETPN